MLPIYQRICSLSVLNPRELIALRALRLDRPGASDTASLTLGIGLVRHADKKTFFSNMLTRSKTPNWVRKPRKKIEIDSESSVTREELEHLFACELRVANADILKLKVYNRDERFTSKSDLPEMKR